MKHKRRRRDEERQARRAEKCRERYQRTRRLPRRRRTSRRGAIICRGFLGRFGLIEAIWRVFKKRANQAKYDWDGCFTALVLRATLGLATMKALVAYIAEGDVSRQLGFAGRLTFSNPIAQFLGKFSVAVAERLLGCAVRSVVDFAGLSLGDGLVIIDSTFLFVYGSSYEKASKGYCSLYKKTMRGYRLQVAYDLRSRLPLAVYLTTGKKTDQDSLATLVQRLARRLGNKRPTLVLDRGYFAIDRCKYLHGKNFPFVVRAKIVPKWVKSAIAAAHRKGYKKRAADYKSTSQEATVPRSNIRVKVVVIRHWRFKKPLVLVSTHLDWTNAQIYNAYKERANIEALFKTLRNGWNLNAFVGTSWPKVIGHVYMAMLSYTVHEGIRRSMPSTYRGQSVEYFRDHVYDAEITADQLRKPLQKVRRELPALVGAVLKAFAGIFVEQATLLQDLHERCKALRARQEAA